MTFLSREWELQQIKGFTQVCKKYLSERSIPFNSVETDFRDGIKLLNFLEIISKSPIKGKWNQNPRNIFFQINNIQIAFNFLREKKLDLTGMTEKDIQEGNVKLTLGLIFQCIKKFLIDTIEDSNEKATNALLSWCKKNTKNYDIEINDFVNSWKNGLAFCALIHNFYSNLFNFNQLSPLSKTKNWETFIKSSRSIGITVCFEEGITNCESSDLIITQVYEIYHFINRKENLQVFEKPIEIMKDISLIPLSSTLSQSFVRSYQLNNDSVQSLQQQYKNKDPSVKVKIQYLLSKINKEIDDEIEQIYNYVNNGEISNSELYTAIKQAVTNLIQKHGGYLNEKIDQLKSISYLINEKLDEIRDEKIWSDYQLFYKQISKDMKDLQNKFERQNKNYKSSDLNSILKEAETKLRLLNSRYEKLKDLNIEINPFYCNPSSIQYQFDSFLQKVRDELDRVLLIEQQISEYINLCESKLDELNDLKKKFSVNKYNRANLNSIYSNISDIISKLDSINLSFDELENGETLVSAKYHPQSILDNFVTLLTEIKDRISYIDRLNTSAQISKAQINQLNQSFPTIFERNQTTNIVDTIYNLEPASNNPNINQNMIKVQPNYWECPSIYDSPLYSDVHPPIVCNSIAERNSMLHNMYKVPPHLQNVLGGERVISVYSDKISKVLNDKQICIRSPFDVGFQRNQDPNSLFNLVKTQKIQILYMNNCYTQYSRYPLFKIRIKNISHKRVQFNFQKGSIVDLPKDQQPLFIAETWSGYIDSFEIKEGLLKWYCMAKDLGNPMGDAKLTPFVFVAPDEYCRDEYRQPWTPNLENWYNNVQPDISGKKSKTNMLFSIENRFKKRTICSLNHSIKIGGIIDDKLFKILYQKSSLYVSCIEGVVSYQYMSNENDAEKAMINTNQMGLVIKLSDTNKYILIEKTDSGKWEGGYCSYDSYNDIYTFNDKTYYKDFSLIPKKNFDVESVIDGMRSDPYYFDYTTYNSQHSRKHLFEQLGIHIPMIHSGQVLIPSIHNLIDF